MLKNLIFLFGFSTFVTIVWISSTVYHNTVTSKISPVNKSRIAPIDSSFDKDSIDKLKTRENIRADLTESTSILTDPDTVIASESSVLEQPTASPTPTGIQEQPI